MSCSAERIKVQTLTKHAILFFGERWVLYCCSDEHNRQDFHIFTRSRRLSSREPFVRRENGLALPVYVTLYDYGVERDLLSSNACGSLELGRWRGGACCRNLIQMYSTYSHVMTVHIPCCWECCVQRRPLTIKQRQLRRVSLLQSLQVYDFTRLKTRKPIWSDDLEAWTMDFHGRVKLASKKNFLLVSENAPTDVLMLFGKVAKSLFA